MASGVLFGGPTPEHDISILTGLQALRELSTFESGAQGIYWTKTGAYYAVGSDVEAEAFLDGVPKGASEVTLRLGEDGGFWTSGSRLSGGKRLDVDTLVLATHGGPGEDGTLQGALDLAGLAYTGPTVAGAALGMDKWAFSAVIANAGLASLPRALLSASSSSLPFAGPYILKPRFGGSSIGIDVVADFATAQARLTTNPHLANGCVVEPYREDLSDVQIALRTYPSLELSAIERPATARRRTLSFSTIATSMWEAKAWSPRRVNSRRSYPAGQREEILSMARVIADVAQVRGVARVDFLANDHEIYVNEINTIPGSLAKYLFVDPPLSFAALLRDLLAEARERPAHRYSAAGADGLVLRSAGSIAAKLA